MKVLVIGATGRVGIEVVKAALQRGAGVRALTRKQPKPYAFPEAVEIALGDLNDPVSIAEAMKGVDKLFLLIGSESVPVELMQALIAFGQAKRAGIKHVTYVSVYRADQFIEVPHFANKYAVEEAIRAGRMPYTILRPAYFVQNERSLRSALTGLGVYPTPAGNEGLAVVDVRDLAEAAAISLTEEGHNGKTYDLVSTEMLRGPDAAATWSKLLHKEVTYGGHGDFDGFEAQLRETGSPSWRAWDLRVTFESFVERGFTNTEDQAARFAALLGRQPRTYSGFAEELAREWAAA
ncbi:MAG: NmrA family NAD(P)-binding protein [Terracidiphilus sp.]